MNSPVKMQDWICCQLGAREHYVIPRVLHEQKYLRRLYTDTWLDPKQIIPGLLSRCLPRLAGRYDKSLVDSKVISFTRSAIIFELFQQLFKRQGWKRIYNRNHWFQKKVTNCKQFKLDCSSKNKSIVICYSYAALDIFRLSKEKNCMTILAQIDAGPVEEDIVADAVSRYLYLQPDWSRAPEKYWNNWKDECQLADRIIVNSQWSRKALVQAGVAEKKIAVVPLMYERKEVQNPVRNYPVRFTREKPLKVLFLGSLIIRKGIAEMLSAAQTMKNDPVEFWFVGDKGVSLTKEMEQNKNIHWIGPVPRTETQKYYQMCDVFILPTLSDGFGLTQLEAMSYGLPVIASNNCGEVVQDGINGILIPEVTSEVITNTLTDCMENPEILRNLSSNTLKRIKDFIPENLYPHFIYSMNR